MREKNLTGSAGLRRYFVLNINHEVFQSLYLMLLLFLEIAVILKGKTITGKLLQRNDTLRSEE
jgi:hypothetical protein